MAWKESSQKERKVTTLEYGMITALRSDHDRDRESLVGDGSASLHLHLIGALCILASS